MIAAAAALAVFAFGAVAMADSPTWSDEKLVQVERNRCADAGAGNGGELLERPDAVTFVCTGLGGETAPLDDDPGQSGNHNRAPHLPPGRS